MTAIKHRPMGGRREFVDILRGCSYFFLLVGALAIGYAAYSILAGQAYQTVELRKFSHEAPLAEPHVPIIGEAIGEIRIPSLGLRAVILQGGSPQILRLGIGHLLGTSMPGESGNVALAGHRDTFFRPLRHIRAGDLIILRTSAGTFRYHVDSTSIVSPDHTDVLRPSNRDELTLITCFPFDYIGSAPNRFVVRASEVRHFGE